MCHDRTVIFGNLRAWTCESSVTNCVELVANLKQLRILLICSFRITVSVCWLSRRTPQAHRVVCSVAVTFVLVPRIPLTVVWSVWQTDSNYVLHLLLLAPSASWWCYLYIRNVASRDPPKKRSYEY
jgi:hypothetical protein